MELGTYIHLNPGRARVMRRAENFRWSCHRDYLYAYEGRGITDTDETLGFLSKRREIAVKKYKEFLDAGVGSKSPWKNAVGVSWITRRLGRQCSNVSNRNPRISSFIGDVKRRIFAHLRVKLFFNRDRPSFLLQRGKGCRNQQEEGDNEASRGKRPCQKNPKASIREDQRLTQILFKHWSENIGQDQRGRFVVQLPKKIAQDPTKKHYVEVKYICTSTVSTNKAEKQD